MAMKFGDSQFIKFIGSYATRKRPEKFRPVFGFFDDDYEQISFINTCSTGPTPHTPDELTGPFSGALV